MAGTMLQEVVCGLLYPGPMSEGRYILGYPAYELTGTL